MQPAAAAAVRGAPAAERILDVAERLVQTRGFNGFSYADVAAELGVTKPSLHYHFPSKAVLGEALIIRYAQRFGAALGAMEGDAGSARRRLRRYADLYADVLDRQRMCLCGMLAADLETLPQAMRAAVLRFFDTNESWLTGVLAEGRSRGELRFRGPARAQAQALIGTLEGAMLVARPYGDLTRFDAAAKQLLNGLTP